MTRKRIAMCVLACTATVWMFTSSGCGGGDDGNDCLDVLAAADVEDDYVARNFSVFFSNCPDNTTNAVLCSFPLPNNATNVARCSTPTPTGSPVVTPEATPALTPKVIQFRYNQRRNDIYLPDSTMTSEFAGCADEDSTVRTVASFGHLVDESPEACTVAGDEVTLVTGLGISGGPLSGTLSFPLEITSECRTCLTSCTVAVGFQLVRVSVGENTPTPTPIPAENRLELSEVVHEALQAGLDSAPPFTCRPTNTPTPTRPTQTPTLTPTQAAPATAVGA